MMRRTKIGLLGTFLLATVVGATLLNTSLTRAQPPERREGPRDDRREGPREGRREGPREDQNYWRHHDGRWSHWDSRDRRWYYTDGAHWYYHNGRAWEPYRFDKTFGRDFERGRYVPPANGATIVVPRHEIYVAPR